MLTELRIRNFAIIESLTLPLARGFNVLSGETGAGKSIIVGALGLLLGERTSADLIRTGADRATVEGVFDVADRCSTSAASTRKNRSSSSSAKSSPPGGPETG
jgi:DNA repair protein RecN (Recombination protein N)